MLTIDHTRGNQATLSWLLYDGHGNWVRLMSPDYTLSGFQWRGVWGEVQGSLGTGRGYCANLGHPEDETGLVYMRARHYEPATGRFISEDPARDGVNWYLYADGNPVNKVDSTGKKPESELGENIFRAFWLLGFMVTMIAITVLMTDGLEGRIQGGASGYHVVKRATTRAIALANLAVALFGIAAVGLNTPTVIDAILAILVTSVAAQAVIATLYSQATANALWSSASIAVMASVVYGTVLMGYWISIGIENQ